MFGGLELKGDGGKKDDQAVKPVPAASGFSFLSTTAPAPAPAAPPANAAPSSAFSFLTGAPSPVPAAASSTDSTAPVPASAPVAALSGFSFLSASPAVAPVAELPLPAPLPAPPAPAAAATTPSFAPGGPSSGFGFMPTIPTTAATEVEIPEPSVAPSTGLSSGDGDGSSSFGFLSASIGASEPGTAKAEGGSSSASEAVTGETSWGSLSAPSSSKILPNIPTPSASNLLAKANHPQPVGSGVVFGGLSAARKPVIKKKSRSRKVGTAAVATAVLSSTPSSIPEPAAAPSSLDEDRPADILPPVGMEHADHPGRDVEDPPGPSASLESAGSARDAAEEATRRAEEFMREMQEKQAAETLATVSSQEGQVSPPATRQYGRDDVTEDYGSEAIGGAGSGGFVPPTIPVSPSLDEDYKEAKAAAKEAKETMAKLAKKKKQNKSGSIFENIFKKPSIFGNHSSSSGAGAPNLGGGVQIGGTLCPDKDDGPSQSRHSANSTSSGISRHSADSDKNSTEKEQGDPGRSHLRGGTSATVAQASEAKGELMKSREKADAERRERAIKEQKELHARQAAAEEKRRRAEEEASRVKLPQEVFIEMLAEFSYESRKSTDRITQLRRHQAALTEERDAAEKQQRLASRQEEMAEWQLTDAVKEEDFELADRLGSVIEKHAAERKEQMRILESIGRALKEVYNQREEVVKGLTKCFADLQKKLQAFQTEQERIEMDDSQKIKLKFEATSKRLTAEEERLNKDLKHLDRDEGLVTEERKELESTISEQTGEIEKEREEARRRLEKVNKEISELRELLAAKEVLSAELQCEAAGHEATISKVRGKFNRPLNRLGKKEAALKEARREWDAERSFFENLKVSHEKATEAHSEALVAHEEMMTCIQEEIVTAYQLEGIIIKEVVIELKDGQSDNEAPDDGLKDLQTEVVKCEAAVDETHQVLIAANAVMSTLRDDIDRIDQVQPTLELQKKQAAARRDFKTAAKASKEIKELASRHGLLERELKGEATERYVSAKAGFEKATDELDANKSIAHQKEKEAGVYIMEELGKKIVRLKKKKKDVCGDVPVEDKGYGVTSVGASVLDCEIGALNEQGEALGAKFGGWNQILKDISVEVGSDEEDELVHTEEEKDDAGNERKENITSTLGVGNISNSQPVKSTNECMAKFKLLQRQLLETEAALESAIAEEDYDQAADLDNKVDILKENIEDLGLDDEVMKLALSGCDEENKRDISTNTLVDKCTNKNDSSKGAVDDTIGDDPDVENNTNDDIADETEDDKNQDEGVDSEVIEGEKNSGEGDISRDAGENGVASEEKPYDCDSPKKEALTNNTDHTSSEEDTSIPGSTTNMPTDLTQSKEGWIGAEKDSEKKPEAFGEDRNEMICDEKESNKPAEGGSETEYINARKEIDGSVEETIDT